MNDLLRKSESVTWPKKDITIDFINQDAHQNCPSNLCILWSVLWNAIGLLLLWFHKMIVMCFSAIFAWPLIVVLFKTMLRFPVDLEYLNWPGIN